MACAEDTMTIGQFIVTLVVAAVLSGVGTVVLWHTLDFLADAWNAACHALWMRRQRRKRKD